MIAVLTFTVFFFLGMIIILAIESHHEEITYARLTNHLSNVKMKHSDNKLAEWKKGDKGYTLSTEPVVKVINGYSWKVFKIKLDDGRVITAGASDIDWVSYIREGSNIKDTDELEYLDIKE